MEKVTVDEMDDLIAKVFAQRKLCDEKAAELTEENKKLSAMEQKATTYMKELGRNKYECPAGSLTITEKWRVNVPKEPENREAFFEYLRERGLFEDLITVNSNTLNAFYKQELKAAKEEGNFDFSIPGIGEAKLFETVTMRKAK